MTPHPPSVEARRLAVLIGVVLATAVATTPGRIAAQAVPPIPHEKYTLPNGLEVILAEDHSVPVVAVNTWFKVGSGDEARGRTGFAHLFEHIMFMGGRQPPLT